MSAREIIEQISVMPEEEVKLVEAALRERRARLADLSETDARPRRERFLDAKAHLFNHYGDLLEKLAR